MIWSIGLLLKASVNSSLCTSTASLRRVRLWNVDSLDQWSVELGKQLTHRIIPALERKEKPALAHESSTNNDLPIPKMEEGKLKEAL